jgi:iduronate 2-sulfatase
LGRELYDHDADPYEISNLADNPQHARTVAELSKQLQSAASATLPESGEIPPVKPGLWAPTLVE